MTGRVPRRARRWRIAAVLAILAGFIGVGAGSGSTPQALAGEPGSVPFLQIRIDQVSPDVVTTGSTPVVTVSGIVTNTGDRPVRDVMVRLEHAAAVDSSDKLRTSLNRGASQYRPVADFITIAAELQRGQEASFVLSAPLRSLNQPALDIDAPGVYPVLVNVNGTPDYGDPARLDDARFLLPVIGVPPDPTANLGLDVGADTSHPVAVTMLWPLADQPRLAPGAPGGTLPVRLTDDMLATSLATGGRLDTLLSAAESAMSRGADPDGAVGRAMCLVVDPDLLVTVNAMTAGYVVLASSDDVDGRSGSGSRPGSGQTAATLWLNRLRTLAHHSCVATLPYAQADLDALNRVGNPGLSAIAVDTGADVIDRILDITSVRGATLLSDGPLGAGGVAVLGRTDSPGFQKSSGSTVVIAAAAEGVNPGGLTPQPLAPQVVSAPFDPAVGAALSAAGTSPMMPSYVTSSLAVRLNHDSDTARRQDALGAMLWRPLDLDAAPRVQILMPTATWNLPSDDAAALLNTLATIIHSGLGVPRPLPAVIDDTVREAAASQTPPTGLPVPTTAAPVRGGFDDSVTSNIAAQIDRVWKLTSALTTDDRTGLTGVQYTAPLREDMLRALSQSVPPDTRNGLAAQRMAVVDRTVSDLYGAVTIVNPGGAYTLATEHSPLPLALHNGLAVPIRVTLKVNTPPGMTVGDLGVIELPPGYLPLRVPIEVNFTQRVAIDVSLRTPDGVPLGEPVRLSVHSNAYGKVLFGITLTASAALALLVGRRLWHRFRGQPDRADLSPLDPPMDTAPTPLPGTGVENGKRP